MPGKKKKVVEECGVVTTLSLILAAAAFARMASSGSDKVRFGSLLSLHSVRLETNVSFRLDHFVLQENAIGPINSDLQSQLLNLCTRDGTPQQARHDVLHDGGSAQPI